MFVVGANDDRAEAKIRGSEFAGALIDEGTLMPENFFKMLLSRLSIEGAQLFVTTNPDSPYHWLKKDFIDRQKELDMKVFSYTIRDNPSLGEKYINDLSKEYQGLWHQRYIEGKWVLADGAVYDFFNDDIHIINSPPGLATFYIVGIDYGTTNPCVFSLIGYNRNLYPNMWLEKEYYYDSAKHLRQKSDYEYTLDLIKFIDGYHVKNILVDPSAASFKRELKRNDIRNVKDAMNDVLPGIRFQSQLLSNGTYKICSNCVESIKEYQNYLWDSKASERGEDKPIKKFDHCFAKGTKITTDYGTVSIEKIKIGDMVLTPIGFKSVVNTFVHKEHINRIFVCGKQIECTSDHKFYTANRGWVMAKNLLRSDYMLISKGSYINSLANIESLVESFHTRIKMADDVLGTLVQITSNYLELSAIPFNLERYKYFCTNTVFIENSSTPSTITLATDFYFLSKFIKNKITVFLKEFSKEIMSKNKDTFVSILCKYKNNEGENEELKIILFKKFSLELMWEDNSFFYQSHIKEIPQYQLTRFFKRNVYNIEVSECHMYFANDILVKNCCDSQRYALSYFYDKSLNRSFTAEDAYDLENKYIHSNQRRFSGSY